MVLSPDLLSSDASSPWTPIKALSALVESAILKKQPGVKHDLEIALRKHKPQFIALLKNPVRSLNDTQTDILEMLLICS